jgi:ribosomal protein S18 acetylase RimI-like enzyme
VVGPLDDKDLAEATRILRLAFGTFLGAPDPENFWSDRDYVYGRQRASHVATFGATLDGKLVGSNFGTNWGSFGFVGPITVHPDLHESGIGRALLDRAMMQFDAWGTRHVGLFTFAHSAKHVALYQKYGFYARFLTAIMSAPVVSRQKSADWSRFSELNEAQQKEALRSCRNVTDALYSGLDLTEEICATHLQGCG